MNLYMLYCKYRMYDEGMEIMVPSHLKQKDPMVADQYVWSSADGKIQINVTRGSADLSEKEDDVDKRLSEYYRGFNSSTGGFKCSLIKKRRLYGKTFGEVRYLSRMMGYEFFNIFMLGSFKGRELVFTIQCVEQYSQKNIHIFENITDSLRIIEKKKRNVQE